MVFNSESSKAVGKRFLISPAVAPTLIYCPPNVFELEKVVITASCPKVSSESCSDDMISRVKAIAVSPDNEPLNYKYRVSGGKITGQGEEIEWNLTGVRAGYYTIEVIVDDGDRFRETAARTITVENCGGCKI